VLGQSFGTFKADCGAAGLQSDEFLQCCSMFGSLFIQTQRVHAEGVYAHWVYDNHSTAHD